MTIRDLLNQILWDKRFRVSDYVITFVHRGEKDDRKTISFSLITEVKASYFVYGDEEDIIIPFHRILEIRNIRTGEVIWQKRRSNK